MYAASSHQLSEEFWKTFGQYMTPVPSASGEKINWINYKTGSKVVRFSLDTDFESASVSLLINDHELFASLILLKNIFTTIDDRDWTWNNNNIAITLPGKDIRRKEDWPEVISFFKQGLITLDAFWTEVRDFIV